MVEVLVTVEGHRAFCSVHGPLPFVWADTRMAAYDALGHLAHHHPRK